MKIEKGKNKNAINGKVYKTQTTTQGKFNESSLSTSKCLDTLSTTSYFFYFVLDMIDSMTFFKQMFARTTFKDSEVRLDGPTTTLTRNLNFLSWSRVFVLLY